MPEPFVPLHQIREVTIDVAAEVRKIVASQGLDRAPGGSLPLSQVNRVYRDLKTLGFFSLVMGRFGNTECGLSGSLRSNDIFDVNTGKGSIFFVVEASAEAIEAFHDDGAVLFKVREWLGDAYRRVTAAWPLFETARDAPDPVRLWDDAFHAPGSPLPRDVRVVPFYHRALAPGVPGAVLVLVKERRSPRT